MEMRSVRRGPLFKLDNVFGDLCPARKTSKKIKCHVHCHFLDIGVMIMHIEAAFFIKNDNAAHLIHLNKLCFNFTWRFIFQLLNKIFRLGSKETLHF